MGGVCGWAGCCRGLVDLEVVVGFPGCLGFGWGWYNIDFMEGGVGLWCS